MAQPKTPQELPTISLTAIRRLAVGESCICSATSPGSVSASFTRETGDYTQQQVFVIDCRTGECKKMFCITRTT